MTLRRTADELRAVLKAHGIKQCVVCGDYELPTNGGFASHIDGGDMGKDATGRDVHARCANKVWKNRRSAPNARQDTKEDDRG